MSRPEGSSGRRRSLGIFPRQALSSLTPIHSAGPGEALKKKRPNSSFFGSSSPGVELDLSASKSEGDAPPPSPKGKARGILKNGRPSSIFGSLRGLHLSADDDTDSASTSLSREPSPEKEGGEEATAAGRRVIHHGEVQMAGGIFRKKKEYLVLTERHLVRFKSKSKASEVFPSRTNTVRHPSMSSIGSFSDLQTVASNSDAQPGIALHQIVAVYKYDDGKPFFSIEIAYLSEDSSRASSTILQLADYREADSWHGLLRATASKARLAKPSFFPEQSVEYLVRRLERERDYDPDHFHVFRVVQRPSNTGASLHGRSSSDDLAKLVTNICYLAIGVHMVHLIPLPRSNQRAASVVALSDKYDKSIYGLLSLSMVNVKSADDDAFELGFREPLRPTQWLCLASSDSAEIGISMRQAVEYLRPEWVQQPFSFQASPGVEDSILPIATDEEENGSFDRTLTAYCAAYHLNTSNIQYAINFDVEDSPQFVLFPPALARRTRYNIYELLAIFRSLRYNEHFRSVCFAGVKLDVLHQLYDEHGDQSWHLYSRTGGKFPYMREVSNSMLVQEVQNLALKSRKLRRMDFSYCIDRKPQEADEEGKKDPGCELVEALYPVCWRQYTNVDWITLNGIELGDTDLDFLVDASVHRTCHFRALEFSHCSLTDRGLTLILHSFLNQDRTLESIDISANLARVSPSAFQGQIGRFSYIRKLNLSRMHRTSGPEPLVALETLLAWRLEELQLNETVTVESIAAYLASPMSDTLREVWLNQCGLKGQDIALFMHSMAREAGVARELHLHVSENRIEEGHQQLVSAIADNLTPSHLTMNMAVYEKEYQFREFLQALRQNNTLRYLDISKASLPGDADRETCATLKNLFAENTTLEELDISGEHAHLEVAKFGIGLNDALTGLINNTTLRVLRIEYQKLGFRGANTLSTLLESNTGLREIYCENNDINLQGLTVLVNALAGNPSLLYLPTMDRDRAEAMQRVEREIESMQFESTPAAAHAAGQKEKQQMSVRKKMAHSVGIGTGTGNAAGGSGSAATAAGSASAKAAYTPQDVSAALSMMKEKWDRQIEKLTECLERNRNIAHGAVPAGPVVQVDGRGHTAEVGAALDGAENKRPLSAGSAEASSLGGLLEMVQKQRTPTAGAGPAGEGDGLAMAGARMPS